MFKFAYRVWEWLTFPFLTLIRPTRVGAHCLVLDGEGRVLLLRQTYRDGWHLPGGGVHRKERLDEAAKREAYEEAGIIAEGDLELLGAYTNLNPRYTDHNILFVIRSWSRVEMSSWEVAETRFFAFDELPPDVAPGLRRRLTDFANKQAVTGGGRAD